ncbi:large ribosomal subunit protein eL30y-like [Rhododendron vialii]|uniref:large ribosomal subunit protein eL30y-like n=1 Tax=Rhododendron vialii TaxID=182163 RepID=UPI00265DB853|nr:large ribosomal subunit protein eL30y-like [Rhododendron vialii]
MAFLGEKKPSCGHSGRTPAAQTRTVFAVGRDSLGFHILLRQWWRGRRRRRPSLIVCWMEPRKLIIISNNCPPLRKLEIEYYAMLSKVGNGKSLMQCQVPTKKPI